ncbi:MAG TPA: hypothetical protein VG900_02250 [Hyphomicrobiaceae bacterium]|nr:hypothetical protein [Hyphomicrobiaceae bacterium]
MNTAMRKDQRASGAVVSVDRSIIAKCVFQCGPSHISVSKPKPPAGAACRRNPGRLPHDCVEISARCERRAGIGA